MKTSSWSCRLLQAASLTGLVVSLRPGAALGQGCAMCATYLGGAADPLSQGIATSIFFMLSMPFLLTGSVAAWIFYMYRRAGVPFDPVNQLELEVEEAS